MANNETQDIKGKCAFDLFPDIMTHVARPQKEGAKREKSAVVARNAAPPFLKSRIEPPKPPNIAHLLASETDAKRATDAPLALVLMKECEEKTVIAGILRKLGYHIEDCGSQVEAVAKTESLQIGIVVLQDGFEGQDLGQSLVHRHMKSLAMKRRRSIYYVLVGQHFNTMHDLQALGESANLVLNVKHAPRFDLILRKGMRQYEELFGLYMEFLQAQGRQ